MDSERADFIGSSDIASVLGANKWRTSVELWLEKTRRAPLIIDSPDKKRRLKRGKRLEPVIRTMVAEDYGLSVLEVNQRHVHPDHSFMRAEIDFTWRVDAAARAPPHFRLTSGCALRLVAPGLVVVMTSGDHADADGFPSWPGAILENCTKRSFKVSPYHSQSERVSSIHAQTKDDNITPIN